MAEYSLSQIVLADVLGDTVEIPKQDRKESASVSAELDETCETDDLTLSDGKSFSHDEFMSARKALNDMLDGPKRRKWNFEESTPKRVKVSYSGPPTVQSSPLTPNRRQTLAKVRQVLFSRNLNQALENVQKDSVARRLVTSVSYPSDKENYNQGVVAQDEELVNDQGTLKVLPKALELDNIPDFKALLEKDPGFLYTAEGKQSLDQLIMYVCGGDQEEGGEGQLNSHIEQADERAQNIVEQPHASTSANGVMNMKVPALRNTRELCSGQLYTNPKTGKQKPAWFELPEASTEYHYLLQNRELFRYVFFQFVQRIQNTVHQGKPGPLVRKILVKMGYSKAQIDVCYHSTRAIVNRFNKNDAEIGRSQFKWIVYNPEAHRIINAGIESILSGII